MMKRIVLPLAALAALTLACPHTALPFCEYTNPSVEYEYSQRALIFVGKVLSEERTREADKFYEGSTYTVQVEELIKGDLPNTIKIFSENSSGRFPMIVGTSYVLFCYEALGRIQVDSCGNSGPLAEKTGILETLRGLKTVMEKR